MCSYREKLVGELFSMLKIRNLDSRNFFHPTSDFGTHLYGERELYIYEFRQGNSLPKLINV